MFPLGEPMFADLGPDGISMFYVSCIISQLVYSLGGSIFKGGVGSEMVSQTLYLEQHRLTDCLKDRSRAILPQDGIYNYESCRKGET